MDGPVDQRLARERDYLLFCFESWFSERPRGWRRQRSSAPGGRSASRPSWCRRGRGSCATTVSGAPFITRWLAHVCRRQWKLAAGSTRVAPGRPRSAAGPGGSCPTGGHRRVEDLLVICLARGDRRRRYSVASSSAARVLGLPALLSRNQERGGVAVEARRLPKPWQSSPYRQPVARAPRTSARSPADTRSAAVGTHPSGGSARARRRRRVRLDLLPGVRARDLAIVPSAVERGLEDRQGRGWPSLVASGRFRRPRPSAGPLAACPCLPWRGGRLGQ